MTDEEIKGKLGVLAAKNYPNVETVTFRYYGSGDSFDSYDVDVEPCPETVDSDDFEDIFWEMVERADSDFENEGSEGTVTFDLKARSVEIDDYYIVRETQHNGTITVGDDDDTE